ncbi:MAG: T9SS type A sorting domain-containing protein [Bacteroidetes bacterium]|nr:T9SS type A sorting domain-containing protein [Bacteroidota bacterium]
MKTKTLAVAALLGISAISSNQLFSQATIGWKQQFNGMVLHESDENYASIMSTFDTLSSTIYYRTSIAAETTEDFDPSSAKALVKGGSNFDDYFAEGELQMGRDIGLPVISAYNTTTGKYRWANKFEPIGINSYVDLTNIEAIGKASGLYAAISFKGKVKYKTATFTSITKPDSTNNNDILLARIDQNGNFVKGARIVPVDASFKEGSIYTSKMAVNTNGDLIAAVQYYGDNTNLPQGVAYKIVTSNITHTVILDKGDIVLLRLDGSMKYLAHTVIKANGNDLSIIDMKADASKNILVGFDLYRFNTKTIHVSTGANGMTIGSNDPVNSFKKFLVKFQPMLNTTSIATYVEMPHFTIETDKMGNILLTSIIDENEDAKAGIYTIKPSVNNSIQLITKYDKFGTYLTHSAITRQQSSYIDGWDTYLDENNNLYVSYGINVTTTGEWKYERQFMSKVRTTGATMTEVWKNSIMAVGSGYHASASSIYAHKNKVLFTALLDPHTSNYKILVSNPLQQIKVNGDRSVSCMIQYNLSGAALSPEEQTEDNNNIAYKTSFDDVSSSLVVYPNPSKDEVNVQITLSENEQATITLFNYNGVAVKNVVTTEVETKLNIAELPAGMYFVEVVSNNGKEVRKLIKE